MIGRSHLTRFFCLALLIGTTPAHAGPAANLADPAAALGLVAHRALYDVNLTSARTGSQIINIRGKMFFEWKPSCEGWITEHRFTLTYDYADSPPMTIGSDFSTFENFDGKGLDFSSRRKKDGEVYEELRGKARLDQKDSSGKAIFSMPSDLSFDLARNTVFPTMHTINLVRKARQGPGFMKTVIFDGSDDQGPVEVNSFIGKPFAKGAKSILRNSPAFKPVNAGAIDEKLLGPGWKVQMAFFPVLADQSTSDYELTMAFHENGVISDMMIEYGDFSVSQKLVALESVKSDSCKN